MIVVGLKQLLPHHSGEDYDVHKRKQSYVEVATKYLLERGNKSMCSSQDSAADAEVVGCLSENLKEQCKAQNNSVMRLHFPR